MPPRYKGKTRKLTEVEEQALLRQSQDRARGRVFAVRASKPSSSGTGGPGPGILYIDRPFDPEIDTAFWTRKRYRTLWLASRAPRAYVPHLAACPFCGAPMPTWEGGDEWKCSTDRLGTKGVGCGAEFTSKGDE